MKITRAGHPKEAGWLGTGLTSRYQCCWAVGHATHIMGMVLEWFGPYPLLLGAVGSHRDQLKMEYCAFSCAHHETVFLLRNSIIREVHVNKAGSTCENVA